jgi:hypothetical protein
MLPMISFCTDSDEVRPLLLKNEAAPENGKLGESV